MVKAVKCRSRKVRFYSRKGRGMRRILIRTKQQRRECRYKIYRIMPPKITNLTRSAMSKVVKNV